MLRLMIFLVSDDKGVACLVLLLSGDSLAG
jgi:hypothetical protein